MAEIRDEVIWDLELLPVEGVLSVCTDEEKAKWGASPDRQLFAHILRKALELHAKRILANPRVAVVDRSLRELPDCKHFSKLLGGVPQCPLLKAGWVREVKE